MHEIELSVVLPAYEEEEALRLILPQLRDVVQKLSPHGEIIVVDSAQPHDETPHVCAQFGVNYQPCLGPDGYGNEVRTGIATAHGKWIAIMDADGSHGPQFLLRLWNERDEYDLLIASRYVAGGQTENPAVLIFMSHVVNIIFRFVLGLKCYDVSNSYRLYRGDQLRSLKLACDHFDIVEEILAKLARAHPDLRIKEIPFTFEKRKAGKTKRRLVLFALGYLGTLWRLRKLTTKT